MATQRDRDKPRARGDRRSLCWLMGWRDYCSCLDRRAARGFQSASGSFTFNTSSRMHTGKSAED